MALIGSRTLRALAGLGLAGAALGLGAVPAAAHDNVIVLGKNQASITFNHRLLTVCDNEDDGRFVYAEARATNWGVISRYSDTYNGEGNCSRYVAAPAFAGQWRLCESPTTCSPWQYV